MSRDLAFVLVAAAAGVVGAATWMLSDSSSSKTEDRATSEATTTTGAASSTSANASLQLRGSSASASSKVLLTGGYLILEPAFSGLVVALDARFRSTLLQLTPAAAMTLGLPAATARTAPIIVYAPQRCAKPSRYELSWNPLDNGEGGCGGWSIRATEPGQEKNKFVEQAIVYTLLFLSSVATSSADLYQRIGAGWVLYLEGDYQFYSATKPERLEGSSVPPVVADGSKTGLGSSAALVSSMVAAMFKHFSALGPALPFAAAAAAPSSSSSSSSSSAAAAPALPFRCMPLATRLSLAHNLAQLIHCSAQGKVGSGFDVSTAFNGSQIYRRFTPQVLTECLALSSRGASASPDATSASIPRSLLMRQLCDTDPVSGWNYNVSRFALPPGLVLVLGDVAGGASTPVMVKKVLEWRASKKEASDALWAKLSASNTRIQQLFGELSEYASQYELEYKSVRLLLAKQPAVQWDSQPSGALPAGQLFLSLYREFFFVRHYLREMGTAAGVDIEPVASQALLDSTVQSRGVLLSGVPGAGGDDAIFAILLDQESVPALETKWAAYAFPDQPERKVSRLHVKEEKDTIRFEEAQVDVSQWSELKQQ